MAIPACHQIKPWVLQSRAEAHSIGICQLTLPFGSQAHRLQAQEFHQPAPVGAPTAADGKPVARKDLAADDEPLPRKRLRSSLKEAAPQLTPAFSAFPSPIANRAGQRARRRSATATANGEQQAGILPVAPAPESCAGPSAKPAKLVAPVVGRHGVATPPRKRRRSGAELLALPATPPVVPSPAQAPESALGGRYPLRRRSSIGVLHAPLPGAGILRGLHFLITGFGDALEAKRRSVALIREHGGSLLPDLPPFPEVG